MMTCNQMTRLGIPHTVPWRADDYGVVYCDIASNQVYACTSVRVFLQSRMQDYVRGVVTAEREWGEGGRLATSSIVLLPVTR